MKILIIGSNKQWAFENHYIKHLTNAGIEVDSFPAHDLFYQYYYKNIFNKVLFRLGISSIYKQINRLLLNHLKKFHYDIIWVFKGMEIFPETLQKIKENDTKLVNFNPDHPFIHSFRGSGNKNVLHGIDKYDLHLCYSLPVKERIENEYGIQCQWLPFGYEKDKVFIPSAEEEKLRACFIGNPDDYRASVLKQLLENNIPLDLYGNNWKKWMPDHQKFDLNIFPPIYKKDFNKVAPQYRLQLNIFRPHNDNSHNMRTFEMPGLGCIMLAPDSKEHRLLFNENHEIFLYNSIEEMTHKARQILELDYSKAKQIRDNALQRSEDSGYSYQARSNQVIRIFKELISVSSQ